MLLNLAAVRCCVATVAATADAIVSARWARCPAAIDAANAAAVDALALYSCSAVV